MATEVYCAANVTCNFGGIAIDRSALGPEKFITITQNEKTYKHRKGIGGRSCRSEQKDPSYTIKINIAQTSEYNGLLSAFHNVDKLAPGGAGIVPFYIADRDGNFKFASTEAYIDGDPEVSFNAEEGDLEWTIIAGSAKHFVGGH